MNRSGLWLLPVVAAALGLTLMILASGQAVLAEPRSADLARPPGSSLSRAGSTGDADMAGEQHAQQVLLNLPLRFIPNPGLDDPAVQYTVRGAGPTLFFTEKGVVFASSSALKEAAKDALVRLRFHGASPRPSVEGLAAMEGVANFFLGNDPSQWQVNVPTYAAVAYRNLYPGIDLIYRGTNGHLKSEFLVAPGADPSAIEMRYSGVNEIRLREDGALLLDTVLGELIETAPLIYQEIDGVRHEIPGRYVLLAGHRVAFRIGAYDPHLPLIIDPTLAYSSFLGDTGFEVANGITIDSTGNMYVAGDSGLSGSGTPCSIDSTKDAFVTKIIYAGGVYTYSYLTLLGGSAEEYGGEVDLDAEGNVYVSGYTCSSNFPNPNAIQPTYGGQGDAFLAKLVEHNGSTTLEYSTYLGGSALDLAWGGLAVAEDGTAVLAGQTSSDNFPTHRPIQASRSGSNDAFVTSIISTTGGLVYAYSTFLGGTSYDEALDVALDTAGNAHVTGYTWSSNFPTHNAFQPSYGGGSGDAFVTKIISTGTSYAYDYSTYLGGDGTGVWEQGHGIAIDKEGNAYVTGYTGSSTFPTRNAIQPSYGGGNEDAFVTKIISTGTAYDYAFSTYLGGDSGETGDGIALDSDGNIYVVGRTSSSDFPTHSPIQTDTIGWDVFLTKIISSTGVYTYDYSTYLGGDSTDYGLDLTVDAHGTAYLVGLTYSSNFPTENPTEPTYGGSGDGFVAIVRRFVVQSGHKWHDQDADGLWDDGEPGLPGWAIQAYDYDTAALVAEVTTGAEGYYEFSLLPGTYEFREVCPAGWHQSWPEPLDDVCGSGVYTATLSSSDAPHVDQDFGNYQYITASGHKWFDRDEDGLWDEDEPGLPSWVIQAYDHDTTELVTSDTTGTDGSYQFSLPPGTYEFREVCQARWYQSQPAPTDNACGSGIYVDTLISGDEAHTDMDFGNYRHLLYLPLVYRNFP